MQSEIDALTARARARHLRFGWWSLAVFLTLGLVLEGFHGFKVGWYLSVASETRRLMWTLAHAHGSLLALVHIAFAYTLGLRTAPFTRREALASACLMASSVLLPGGFFLGGIVVYGGDPNPAVLLSPVGGILFLVAVVAIATGHRVSAGTDPSNPTT